MEKFKFRLLYLALIALSALMLYHWLVPLWGCVSEAQNSNTSKLYMIPLVFLFVPGGFGAFLAILDAEEIYKKFYSYNSFTRKWERKSKK